MSQICTYYYVKQLPVNTMISRILSILWLILRIVGCYFRAIWQKIMPRKPKDIRRKLVLVTGGRRGIGRALAMEFAKHRANIALWDIDKEETDQVAADIRAAFGVKVMSYECDVTDVSMVKATATQVRRDMGTVDILVNNAGVGRGAGILENEEEKIRTIFNVNILSHFWTVREFLPDMLEKKEGHLLSVASLAGVIGLRNIVDYSASKFAVRGMCDSLEQELRVNYNCPNIKVSVLFPVFVKTEMFKSQEARMEFKDGDIVSPEYAAQHTVAGVLKNQRIIFAPPSWSPVQYLALLLPKEAYDMVLDAILPKEKTTSKDL